MNSQYIRVNFTFKVFPNEGTIQRKNYVNQPVLYVKYFSFLELVLRIDEPFRYMRIILCFEFNFSSKKNKQKIKKKSKNPAENQKKIKKKQKTQKYLTLRTRSLRVTSSSEKIVFYEFKEVFKTQRRFLFMNKIKKQNIMTRCKKFKMIMQFGRVQTRKHVIIFFLQNFKMLFSPLFFGCMSISQ